MYNRRNKFLLLLLFLSYYLVFHFPDIQCTKYISPNDDVADSDKLLNITRHIA